MKKPQPAFTVNRYKPWDPFASPTTPPSSIAKQSRKKLAKKPSPKPKPAEKVKRRKVKPEAEALAPRVRKKRKQYKSRLSQVLRVPNELVPQVLALIDNFRASGVKKDENDQDSY